MCWHLAWLITRTFKLQWQKKRQLLFNALRKVMLLRCLNFGAHPFTKPHYLKWNVSQNASNQKFLFLQILWVITKRILSLLLPFERVAKDYCDTIIIKKMLTLISPKESSKITCSGISSSEVRQRGAFPGVRFAFRWTVTSSVMPSLWINKSWSTYQINLVTPCNGCNWMKTKLSEWLEQSEHCNATFRMSKNCISLNPDKHTQSIDAEIPPCCRENNVAKLSHDQGPISSSR